ncbi:FYN-binding protein 1 isoform X2 [Hypomesus transpacificus]|uniref:FYN-binding protein 1 isoform X2 n=1 Tax=Hypomesus transpacificus TaxID=137520 RepID=UPI001F07869E|nr:FYN-binding protein 1 isoform X2 [Hypomesus transpacificus]
MVMIEMVTLTSRVMVVVKEMESKSDVKTIMARFSTGNNNTSTSDLPSNATGHPKTALHPTLSSGPPIHTKKTVLETRSGGALSFPPKPIFTKSSVTNSSPEVRELANTRAKASLFSGSQDDSKPSVVKQHPFKLKATDSPSSFSSQDMEAKIPPFKPLKSPPSFTAPETRPVFPKPPPASFPKPPPASFPKPSPGGAGKPPWVKEDSNEGLSTPLRPPLQKPPSSFAKLLQQSEDGGEAGLDPKPVNGSALKSSTARTGQSIFKKEGQSDNSGGREFPKPPLTPNNSTPVAPPASKKPSIVRKRPEVKEDENADPLSVPKKNPLPNIWALGTAPAKPNRPPRVTLDSFRREAGTDGATVKKSTVPPPPAFHPTNHMTPPPPPHSHPAAPILPPRPIIQPDQDENYDDIGVSRPEGDGSDGEMYEDLDERWGAVELKEQEKKKEKDKKKQDIDKKEQKEQKEREKKEQEARKKFKFTGPVQVVHRAKARVDCKGGRTDLGMKQGDTIEIIRVQDNPEGRWLGRTKDGAYGYVKTELVEVDIESLKRQAASDPEIYDDVDFSDRGPAVVLPPPPEEDGDIYDDLEDPNFIASPCSAQESRGSPKTSALVRMLKGLEDWRKIPRTNTHLLPPPQFLPEGKSAADQSEVDQEIYDDIDTQGVPLPPPISSHPLRSKEIDPKKLKKLEKEEKEFRKKFKFDGEIMVLYQVTVTASPSTKKGGGKELQLTPGESLDVISKAVDNKLICRNNEGKFGYVQTSNIVAEDSDIYDDIDASVYDND